MSLRRRIAITESEWKVMEVVWSDPPVTAQRVTAAIGAREGWKPQTIKTLIGRLVRKNALSFEAQGNRYLYSPAISREQAVAWETESFLGRISRGSLAPVLMHLVETEQALDHDELRALRQLLEKNQPTTPKKKS